jgi:hypothetical protein
MSLFSMSSISLLCVSVILIAAPVPLTILTVPRRTQASFKRGRKKEIDHLESWKRHNNKGIPIAEVEPPDTIDEIS